MMSDSRLDHTAFERMDNENLDMALGAYTCSPEACRAHMLKTTPFNWNLRNHAAFREAFEEDAMELDLAWMHYSTNAPPLTDSVITWDERNLIKYGKGAEVHPVLDKIAAEPKRFDIGTLLAFRTRYYDGDLTRGYTRLVHEQLVALKNPLKALIHDVDNKREALLKPPVRAIGIELHHLGGKNAQELVYDAIVMLLYNEVSHCDDGDVWSDAKTSLNTAWDGCGDWVA